MPAIIGTQEPKRLFLICGMGVLAPTPQAESNKSFFASFFSKKEVLSLTEF
jgi:hypothetical protein